MIIITFNNHSAHIVRFSNQFFNSKVNSIFTKNLVHDPLFFIATQPIFVFEKTSPVHFEDVFKTFLRHLQDVLPRHLQVILPRHLQDVSKMSSRHLQDVFKIYHQVKQSLITLCQCVFKTFSRRIQHFFQTYCEDVYLQKDLPGPLF